MTRRATITATPTGCIVRFESVLRDERAAGKAPSWGIAVPGKMRKKPTDFERFWSRRALTFLCDPVGQVLSRRFVLSEMGHDDGSEDSDEDEKPSPGKWPRWYEIWRERVTHDLAHAEPDIVTYPIEPDDDAQCMPHSDD